jgi:hypothetical protein
MPVTIRWFPTRTAREKPKRGSQASPDVANLDEMF